MTKQEYINADPRYHAACARRDRAYSVLEHGNRWGDCRRFAGRAAGHRLSNIERANAFVSRTYVAAEKKWLNTQTQAARQPMSHVTG